MNMIYSRRKHVTSWSKNLCLNYGHFHKMKRIQVPFEPEGSQELTVESLGPQSCNKQQITLTTRVLEADCSSSEPPGDTQFS